MIHIDEYKQLGLPYPRRRTHVDENGYVFVTCYACKSGKSYEREDVVDGVWDDNCWETQCYKSGDK